MADPTHDTAEDGFHEIQLSGKQLVFLFMVMTVILVVTFLSGVLVGRAVGTEEPAAQDTIASATDAAPDDVPTPPDTNPTERVPDDLNGIESLHSGKPGGEVKAPPPADPPPPAPEPEPERPATETAKPEKPERAPEQKPSADVPTSGRPGTWFLQLSALRNRDAAADMVRSLAAKGYPAYLQEPRRGDALYRVRIGRYRDRAEAEAVAARLKKQEDMGSDVRRN